MNTFNLGTQSPLGIYQEHLKQGRLAYQEDSSGQAVFPPRIGAPKSGEDLIWKISNGLGTVYSTTVIYQKDQKPYNVALIELDEGFRMMSRVEGVLPEQVFIGMRVQVEIILPESGNSIPVFKSL